MLTLCLSRFSYGKDFNLPEILNLMLTEWKLAFEMIFLSMLGLRVFSLIAQSDKISLIRIYVERCLLQQEHN